MKPTRFSLILVISTVMAASAAGAIVVDLNGAGDYLTLGEGIAAAASGDTVLVAPGVYTGPLNRDLNFAGKEIVVRAMQARDPVIIDAWYSGRCFIFENGEGSLARVEGLVLYRGDAGDGGGVYCSGSVSPVFENCEFVSCTAYRGGGVDCVQRAAPTFIGCEFRENIAQSAGGGVRASDGASIDVVDCAFVRNLAGLGGGLMVRAGSSATVVGGVFEQNTADYSAGLRCEDSNVSIEGSTFLRNDAHSGGGVGSGGLSLVTMSECLFLDNTASFRGSGYACGTPAIVEYCTFVGGSAPTGSGIFCGPPQGDMQMTYCIVAYGDGPAMTCDPGGHPTVTRCCFHDNVGGPDPCGTYSDILHEDPLFCDMMMEDFTVNSDSVCAPANNPWGEQIGAFGVGCTGGVPVEPASWTAIKAMYR